MRAESKLDSQADQGTMQLEGEEDVYRARRAGLLAGVGFRPKLVDLFCGAGGMTLGFTGLFGHTFEPVWANDSNQYAAATYNANFGEHCVPGDILEFLRQPEPAIPAADVVLGGPPCQGFSLLNRNRNGDDRKQLWKPFLEVVARSGASVFVMENVPYLIGSAEYAEIMKKAAEMGFVTARERLCAADYGVAQIRWRAFIVGCNFADPGRFFPPKKTHQNQNNGQQKRLFTVSSEYVDDPQPWVTVWDKIGDLPSPQGTGVRDVPPPMNLHFGRKPTDLSIRRYEAVPEEGMNRFDLEKRCPELTPECWKKKRSGGTDLFGRLWRDRPAFTIRTEFMKPEKGRYLHPLAHRALTHREAARLQSFPDEFQFEGPKIEIARQIGNAVPPLLAARVADSVYALLLSRKRG